MAKCKILMQTAQVQKLVTFFDGYKDDKVELKYVSKAGIKATFECETELLSFVLLVLVFLCFAFSFFFII